jgi:hypothetical protein
VLDAVRASAKEGLHELLLDRIRGHEPARADRLAHAFDQLDERDARGWVDRLARAYQLALLAEAGYGEYIDRLATRPLGLAPGARP